MQYDIVWYSTVHYEYKQCYMAQLTNHSEIHILNDSSVN